MVKTVPNDLLLELLKPEITPDLPATVSRSWNGLILKRQREKGKAQQEFEATRLARFLLPRTLAVPRPWGVVAKEYYVSESIDERFNRRDPEQVRKATDYLVALHAVPLDHAGLGRELLQTGFAHYRGETLKSRLKHELGHAQRAFAGRRLGGKLERYAELIAATLLRWTFDDDVVLGHGDFRAGNLFVRGGAIVPIDWVDLGLCDRAYEVMHFFRTIPAAHRAPALRRYTASTGTEIEAIRTRGSIVSDIIRAGSSARMLELGACDPDECARRFVQEVEMLENDFLNVEGL
jgi:aminoglycoside phosphotransferase (APT) family kinase protein